MVVDVQSFLINLSVWSFNIDDGCTCNIQKCYVSGLSLERRWTEKHAVN